MEFLYTSLNDQAYHPTGFGTKNVIEFVNCKGFAKETIYLNNCIINTQARHVSRAFFNHVDDLNFIE